MENEAQFEKQNLRIMETEKNLLKSRSQSALG